jgi:hypothetical protein
LPENRISAGGFFPAGDCALQLYFFQGASLDNFIWLTGLTI